MARERVVYLGHPVNAEEPLEEPADGCPGAWYRVPLTGDLEPYRRTRTDTGDRVDNPRFAGASWLVQDMVMEFEREQEQSRAYLLAAIDKIHAADAKRRDAARTMTPGPLATARPGRRRR